MNKSIINQLNKCTVAIIPSFDETTNEILIPSLNKSDEISIFKDKYYLIKLEKYILNPPDDFNLNSNWNKGINPKSEYLLVTPIKFLGKMVQFDGCGYDNLNYLPKDDIYSGLWLPRKGFNVVKEI